MNDDLNHERPLYADKMVNLYNKGYSFEQLSEIFKCDGFEVILCLRHMSVIENKPVRPFGFRHKNIS
ncbi:hypothetical protein [Paraliobacillus ryukyuensis]|uniref:hypothetical protein n=1 Tax=Paraliobacillus ryukyuensis TaxID=200904 RepID=UPI00117D0F5F|nr:hypothetical protein [Paraliobacillus ryukyuensis]